MAFPIGSNFNPDYRPISTRPRPEELPDEPPRGEELWEGAGLGCDALGLDTLGAPADAGGAERKLPPLIGALLTLGEPRPDDGAEETEGLLLGERVTGAGRTTVVGGALRIVGALLLGRENVSVRGVTLGLTPEPDASKPCEGVVER